MIGNNKDTKNSILDDYYKCIGAFKNCEFVYNETAEIMNSCDKGSEEYMIAKGRQEDLLSNLGKVGEKALKYIISLELLRTNPNINPVALDEFFRKRNSLKNFATNHKININDSRLEALMDYPDLNNQKGHNFDYWYSVLELTMPNLINTFKCLIYNSLQSESIQKHCDSFGYGKKKGLLSPWGKDSNIFYHQAVPESLQIIISPGYLEHLSDDDLKYTVGSQKNFLVNLLINSERDNIKKCGDVFTRLRYSANNPDKKSFSVKKLFKTINYFIFFITLIHENNDELSIDIETAYAKSQIIKYQEMLNVTKEDVDKIFANYVKSSWDVDKLLTSRFTLEEISTLIDLGVSLDDLYYIIEPSKLSIRAIEYYKSIEINDYNKMIELLDKNLQSASWTIPYQKKKN